MDIFKGIKPMAIIVCRKKRSPISWWIRWRTGDEWSHVCLVGRDNTIFTTTRKGYALVRADEYLKDREYEVLEMELPDERIRAGFKFNHELIGTPYSYTDFGRLILRNLKGKGTKGMKNNSKNVYCAESVAETYRAMGITLFEQTGKKPNEMLPADCGLDHRLKLKLKK